MYLLDTDWTIQTLGRRERTTRTRYNLVGSGIHVSVITLGEVFDGAFVSINPQAHLTSLRHHLAAYQILALNDPIMERFAEISIISAAPGTTHLRL